jgi:hypothetical protein
MEHLEAAFTNSSYFARVRNVKWVKQAEENSRNKAKSLWKFADEQGNPWSAVASIEPIAGERDAYIVSVKVNRLSGNARRGPTEKKNNTR